MIDKSKIGVRERTIKNIVDINDELTLDWKIAYDDNTDEIIYEDRLIALLNIGDEKIFDGPYIEQFEVFNSYKNMGYGTAIIEVLLSEVDECYVLPESVDAAKFWKKIGFCEEYDGVGEYVWHYEKAE